MKTIMVVDNKRSILKKVKNILEDQDFQVTTVKSNKEALELISQDEEDKFKLILIDTKLPESTIPAFFSMKPASKMNIDTTDDSDYLQKPFTKNELLDFVKRKI